MNRGRILGLAIGLIGVSIAAACGGSGSAAPAETLPPIATTTTTSTTILVTTTVQRYYVIKRGDTLSKIAQSFNVRVEDLMALNGIVDPDKIEAGDELEIPQGVVVVDSLPTPPSDIATSTTIV